MYLDKQKSFKKTACQNASVDLRYDPTIETRNRTGTHPNGEKASHRERDDNYQAVVCRLNATWRVIRCKDSIQWILQHRHGTRDGNPQWQGAKYCRTRDALIRECGATGLIDKAAAEVLESLPEKFGGRK